jgi:hypothetical protein
MKTIYETLDAFKKLSKAVDAYAEYYAVSGGLVERDAKREYISQDIRALYSELATKKVKCWTDGLGYVLGNQGDEFFFSVDKDTEYARDGIAFEITMFDLAKCDYQPYGLFLMDEAVKPTWLEVSE